MPIEKENLKIETLPCKGCLKFPVCKYKKTIYCEDLTKCILEDNNNLILFEKLMGREAATVFIKTNEILMKIEPDIHACMIAMN